MSVLTGFESPERIQAPLVSVGFLNALGRPPIAGRLFQQGEDEHGHDTHLAVLTEAFWHRRFGGDRNIVGRSLVLDGEPFRVIGVVPTDREWLSDVEPSSRSSDEGNDDRGSFELSVIARLRDGITPDAAAADLRASRQATRKQPSRGQCGSWTRLQPLVDVGSERSDSPVALAADGSGRPAAPDCLRESVEHGPGARVRPGARDRDANGAGGDETAPRASAADGGTRAGRVRHRGRRAAALWALSIVRTLQVRDLARLADASVNGWALLFTVAIMGCAALLVAAIPALHTANPDLVATLRDGDRGRPDLDASTEHDKRWWWPKSRCR